MKRIISVFLICVLVFMLWFVSKVIAQPKTTQDLFNDGKIRFWLAPYPWGGDKIMYENMYCPTMNVITYVNGAIYGSANVFYLEDHEFIHTYRNHGKIITFTYYRYSEPSGTGSTQYLYLGSGQFTIP